VKEQEVPFTHIGGPLVALATKRDIAMSSQVLLKATKLKFKQYQGHGKE